jgi:hypothetical protein
MTEKDLIVYIMNDFGCNIEEAKERVNDIRLQQQYGEDITVILQENSIPTIFFRIFE